jgi:hypothetical protein
MTGLPSSADRLVVLSKTELKNISSGWNSINFENFYGMKDGRMSTTFNFHKI